MLTLIAAAALYARVTVITPREGMTAEFEAGYAAISGQPEECRALRAIS